MLPTASARQTWRAIAQLGRPHRALASGALVVLVAGTAVGLLVPVIIGSIVDAVLAQRGLSALREPIVALFAVAAATAVLGGFGAILVSRLGETMLAGLREQLLSKALGLPLGQLEAAGSGDLVSRISGDVAAVASAVRTALPNLVRAVLTIALTLIGLAALDWRFAIAGMLAAPIQASALVWYLKRSTPLFAAQRVAVAHRTQRLLDAVRGAGTVRTYLLGGDQLAAIRTSAQDASRYEVATNRVATRFYGRLNLAEVVGLSATLIVGFALVDQQLATVGAASAAALYFHRLFDPVNAFLGLFGTVQEAGACLARLVGVVEAAPDALGTGLRPRGTRVLVEEVAFRYPGTGPVLHGISLEIHPGERVALVGESGAGKTTLASLVAGTHRPTVGSVSIGGVPVAAIDPQALRGLVHVVTQDIHVFAGTIAENLRLGRPDADEARLLAAAARVDADGWIMALPHGMATEVGEGGLPLTSTQAQHLALARLVLADPQVVVMDEATADSGSAGARILDRAAAEALAGRTALVVAHRLSQAAACDRVVVMEAGRITEQGTPEQLIEQGGSYARLWQIWAGAHAEEPLPMASI